MKSRMTGKQFRTMRENLGFKKREHIAERIGVSRFAVEKWENGQRPVPEYARKRLLDLWARV